jgi:hypothetical protein
MSRPDKEWSARDVELVRQMAPDHYARAIAERLGRTRNQVIGYCRRHRIKLKHAGKPAKPGRPRKKRKRTGTRMIKQLKAELVAEIANLGQPQPLHLHVVDLTLETCRWPYGERHPFTFCGHKILIFGQAYCPFHQQLSQP